MANPFEHKTQNFTSENTNSDDIFMQGFEKWSSEQGMALHSARNWRFFALLLILTNLISILGMWHFATRSTVLPYIVEVDATSGAVLNTSKVLNKNEASKREIQYFIWHVVKNARMLPKDMVVYEANWSELYAFLGTNASQKMNDMAIREDHKTKLQDGITTMLQMKAITPLSGKDDTYNVRWSEVQYDYDGSKIMQYDMEAYFTVEQVPVEEKMMQINPLGIMVKDFNISKVQGGN